MDPWYKVATPRKEVRDGRSFNPDEFAIALEQVVRGTAPEHHPPVAKQQRGPDYLRLAAALSALYPLASEERRLLDASPLAVPRARV
jgi:hypothetical protein